MFGRSSGAVGGSCPGNTGGGNCAGFVGVVGAVPSGARGGSVPRFSVIGVSHVGQIATLTSVASSR
jgi:hypothetical protein